MTDDKLAVTQEAREAAANWFEAQGSWGGTGVTLAMRRGERDNHSLIQAFARFEAQARLAGERAGMERAAGIADIRAKEHASSVRMWDSYGGPPHSGRERDACYASEAASIRAAILKEAASITQTPTPEPSNG